jgi:hypothetical protein
MSKYRIHRHENPDILERLINADSAQGWTLEHFAVGPVPYENYNGDIVGTQSEAWAVLSRQEPTPMSVVRKNEEQAA